MAPASKELQPLKSPKRGRPEPSPQQETQQRTEEALRELFRHVHNMPDSAKKKKLIRQVVLGGALGSTPTPLLCSVHCPGLGASIPSALGMAGLSWELGRGEAGAEQALAGLC